MIGQQESSDAARPFPSDASLGAVRRVLTPGDWVHIEHQGKKLVGMIDRLQGNLYTFAYWDGGVLKFGTTRPDHIGAWDEELTGKFRGAIAIDPNYLAKFIALWAVPPTTTPSQASPTPHESEGGVVQKWLFPN